MLVHCIPFSQKYFHPMQFPTRNLRFASVECWDTTYGFFAPQFEPLTMHQLSKTGHHKARINWLAETSFSLNENLCWDRWQGFIWSKEYTGHHVLYNLTGGICRKHLCCCLGYCHALATNHRAGLTSSAHVNCDPKSAERLFFVLMTAVLDCSVNHAWTNFDVSIGKLMLCHFVLSRQAYAPY